MKQHHPRPAFRCACLGVAAVFAATAVDAARAENEQHITHGPILGRVSAHGIGVWARTLRPGAFVVRYGTEPGRLDQATGPVETRLEHDNTGWVHIPGLTADTKYHYELAVPDKPGLTGRGGSFRTLPDSRDYVDSELNPRGLFNVRFEFACGNNQNPGQGSGPGLPGFQTMHERLKDSIHFAILNGDWLYESQREFTPEQWLAQIGAAAGDAALERPRVVEIAPTITGVWQNYKHFLDQGENLARWHRDVPSFFTYDDHEILNDVWGAGTPGLRDRRAVFRDIGVQAWYDYLAWSNPTTFTQPIHFGRAELKAGSNILTDPEADFKQLDVAQANNLHVHWGTPTAGVNDNALDGEGGVPNAGVYRIARILDKNRLEIDPPARADGRDAYSIGRRSYFRFQIANCDFFVLDTRGQREMHDTTDPAKPGLSMLGPAQRDWLLDGVRKTEADFVFVVSSVNFMVPHVGGGAIRSTNKDDAWTVFFDEREKLIEAFDRLERPVFVLTGDLHNSFVIRITDNVWEMASGPHNSNNHWYTDEGDRPPNGRFKDGPRACDIRWSTWFKNDIPRENLLHPMYC
ncbi:MAG TPA: metallophosphoesterase family protein, partial [Planctomycetaceae bacterium]|nr:metallophosphoesterase family protein [Planctomycetaceae bacterium]